MALVLNKTTRYARVYLDEAVSPRQGFMKATREAMNYESVPRSGNYDTTIDLENVATDSADIDGYVMNAAAYNTQIQTDVETGVQPDQGTMIYTFGGHSISFLFADMAYLRTDTRVVTPFGGGLDYTVAAPLLEESTLDLGSHAGVASDVVTCKSRVRWDQLQVHDSESPELSHCHHAERYKIMMLVHRSYREWIDTNDPPAQTQDTLAGMLFEVDWSDIPRVYLADGTEVDPLLDDFTDDLGGIYLKDEAGRQIGYMPQIDATSGNEAPNSGKPVTTRFWTDGGTSYMYKGVASDSNEWGFGQIHLGLLTEIYTRDEGEYEFMFGGQVFSTGYPQYWYHYNERRLMTVGEYGTADIYTGIRFESPIPRGASLTNGGANEYAEMRLYAGSNTQANDVEVDAWTDVQIADGPRFAGEPAYTYYLYTDQLANFAIPVSPDWTDSSTYSTTTLTQLVGGSDDAFEAIDIAAQMEESIGVTNWAEENGLRVRVSPGSGNGSGYYTETPGYQATVGIGAVLTVFFTDVSPRMRHTDESLQHREDSRKHKRTKLRHNLRFRHNR